MDRRTDGPSGRSADETVDRSDRRSRQEYEDRLDGLLDPDEEGYRSAIDDWMRTVRV